MKLIPNVPAPIYTLSAMAVGLILIDDSSASEQNALGNWFQLVGQVLETNSAQQQLIDNRLSDSNNQSTINNNRYTNTNESINNQIVMLQKAVGAMNAEIDNLKKRL